MNPTPLDKVLACTSLPTLPGVAMKVLDLTRDPQVSISKLAAAVQNDPALSTKVLKTVNSSYYGLTTPCPSISRATGLLGLNTVKSIVLGFSIVETTRSLANEDSFDLTAYWRRAVFSAAGARALALHTKSCDPEEAFMGALLQDIGMLAAFVALKMDYARVVLGAGPDHDDVSRAEQAAFSFDHSTVGQKLGEKWRLPPQLVECIRKHHAAETSNPAHESLVRCVAMGGLAAAALTLSDPKRKLGQFIVRGREWFKLDQPAAKDLIQQIAKGAAEISKFLEVKTGAAPDVSAILAEAHEQLLAAQEAIQRETLELRRSNSELTIQNVTDALTGAFNRAYFDREFKAACDQAEATGKPIGICFIDGDKFKSVNDTHGHRAGDAVLTELARRFKECVGPAGAVCRYGGEEFAVILPGLSLNQAAAMAESLRAAVERTPFDMADTGAKVAQLPVTISVGVAARETGGSPTPEAMIQLADKAVYEAKRSGRNRVCTHTDSAVVTQATGTTPAAAPTATPAPRPSVGARGRVFIVDDDPLAQKLIQVMLRKHAGLEADTANTGESAATALQKLSTAATPPSLVICDLRLPGMSGLALIKWMKSVRALASIPVVVLSGNDSAAIRNGCTAVGALLFIEKSDFCTNSESWIAKILAAAEASRAA